MLNLRPRKPAVETSPSEFLEDEALRTLAERYEAALCQCKISLGDGLKRALEVARLLVESRGLPKPVPVPVPVHARSFKPRFFAPRD
jgi:hypothetical protein